MITVSKKSFASLVYSIVILAVGVASFLWLLSVPGAKAQPAVYSTESGILEIPNLRPGDSGAYRDVGSLLVDARTGEFTLVDFKR